jgi:hypothetical protein
MLIALGTLAALATAFMAFHALRRARRLHTASKSMVVDLHGWASDAFWLGVLWAYLALLNTLDLVKAIAQ